jgi:hypothetical protein
LGRLRAGLRRFLEATWSKQAKTKAVERFGRRIIMGARHENAGSRPASSFYRLSRRRWVIGRCRFLFLCDLRQLMDARPVAPAAVVLPARCDQIPTPAENQIYPYSGHSCAHRYPHDSGKLLKDVNHRTPGAVMSIIPLDLQRRCEQRWATRFSRPVPSAAPRYQRPVRESLQIAAPTKSEEQPATPTRRA